MRIPLGVLALSLFLTLVASATSPAFTSYFLGGSHAYDIHWVTNSPVGFLLTNDGSGFHRIYRSSDYGLHWAEQALNNPTGLCYVLRIIEDPMNPQNLFFMGPPEANCAWTSTDTGLTFNYRTIPGLQYITFSPNASGSALGRSGNGVYLTTDGGNTWNQINATRAAWAPRPVVPGTYSPRNIYLIKGNTLGYSEDLGESIIPIFDNMNELHTTSNFVYSTAINRTLVVGQDLGYMQRAYFPFGDTVPYVFTVSDDSSGATWFYTDASAYWGNIYTAGTSGALYVEKLQHVLKRDDATLDIHSVQGLPGVHIANQVINYNDYHDLQLKTYITFNNGGDWTPLAPPSGSFCVTCNLNLYFNYKTDMRAFYSNENIVGLLLANGYVAQSMSYDTPVGLNPYLSRNAGLSWEMLTLTPAGPYLFEFGMNGGILVMAPENQMTSTIYYSFDQGITISSYTLSSPMYITGITSQKSGTSSVFVLYGLSSAGTGTVYGLDFSPFQLPTCGSNDYENWAPSDGQNIGCWMGQTVVYSRRQRASVCNDTRGEMIVSQSTCPCTLEDYECDFGFAPGVGSTCIVSGFLPPSPPPLCKGTYEKSQGFRLVPGDKCSLTSAGAVNKLPEVFNCPETPQGTGSSSKAWVVIVVILVVLVVVGLIGFIIYRDPVMKEKVLGLCGSRSSRYGRMGTGRGNRSSSLAHEEDFGIQDDLLEEGGEEDAKVLQDNDISRASSASKNTE